MGAIQPVCAHAACHSDKITTSSVTRHLRLPTSNKIKVLTMKVSKGLEFPVVALPGVGHMPAVGEDEK